MTAPAVNAGLRILHDYAGEGCGELLQELADILDDETASVSDRALILLNTNSAPHFRLDHARLSDREVFALRDALIAAADLAGAAS